MVSHIQTWARSVEPHPIIYATELNEPNRLNELNEPNETNKPNPTAARQARLNGPKAVGMLTAADLFSATAGDVRVGTVIVD
jgi:hypothetical protein